MAVILAEKPASPRNRVTAWGCRQRPVPQHPVDHECAKSNAGQQHAHRLEIRPQLAGERWLVIASCT